MSEREKGWYWIRPDDPGDPWEAGHWSGSRWSFMRTRQQSASVAVAGTRIPTPDELITLRETARLAEDAPGVTCACGDMYPPDSYGAGFMAANGGVCENCAAAEDKT